MIQRIDHVIAVADDPARTQARLLEIGCPLVWDGRSGEHRDIMFAIGPVKLELLATAAFDGWPALSDLAAGTDRRLGVRVAAFDPGDLDQTITDLRALGIAVGDAQDGQLAALTASAGDPPIARWRNAYVDGLRGLLPGLPAFLCQIATPDVIRAETTTRLRHDLPVRFVELQVGVPDPASAILVYEQVLGIRGLPADAATGEIAIPLADTPIRLVRGAGLRLVLEATHLGITTKALAAELPGVLWTEG